MGPKVETKIKGKFLFALVLMLSLSLPLGARGDAVLDQLNADKADKQKKLDQLNQQIRSYQQQIAQTQAKTSSLKNEISIYEAQIASTQLAIEAKQTQIEDANLQIEELKHLIDLKNAEIEDNKKVLGQLIVELSQYDDQYALKTTVGSSNISDFFDQIQYNQSLQDRVYQLVQKIKDLKSKLQDQQHDLEVHVQQLQELQNQLQITQDSLSSQRNQKQQLLNQTKGLERNYQKLLSSSQQDEANLQKEVQNLDDQIRAKLGKRTITPSKGSLAWPIDGVITQGYGNTGFTALGYNFHNGIDIAGPAGAPEYAAADGTVLYTDMSDTSYGNWVAIKHTISTKSGVKQIITLYGHMRSIKVSPGQKVSQGDLIGYEGNTGNTTKKLYGPERGYHVHFGVYDAEGFGVADGAYTKIYGAYKVPYGYTYNPLDFLGQ